VKLPCHQIGGRLHRAFVRDVHDVNAAMLLNNSVARCEALPGTEP
jgi:hypothetical protein